jgi:hypothetical protein
MTAIEEQESTPIFAELTEQLGFSQDTTQSAAEAKGEDASSDQPAPTKPD